LSRFLLEVGRAKVQKRTWAMGWLASFNLFSQDLCLVNSYLQSGFVVLCQKEDIRYVQYIQHGEKIANHAHKHVISGWEVFESFSRILHYPHSSLYFSFQHKFSGEIIMHRFAQISTLSLVLAGSASAHFEVLTPAPLGLSSNINNENLAPCGGFSPSSSDTLTDFHVGGDAVGLITLHAQAGFAYRGMLGASLTSPNWTVLIPTLEEYGLNGFCEPGLSVPSSWAGSSGLLQIIQDAEDGVHYQVCLLL
jgi:hypothetical protein